MSDVGVLPDPDTVVVPDVPEAIVGYRRWVFDSRTGRLLSPMFGYDWPETGPLEATCAEGLVTVHGRAACASWSISFGAFRVALGHPSGRSCSCPARAPHDDSGVVSEVRRHEVPCPPGSPDHGGHGCGIYAIRDPAELSVRMGGAMMGAQFASVYGEVWLSGTVYEYSEGYRASRATPKAIWRGFDRPDWHPAPSEAALQRVADRYGIPLIDPPEEALREPTKRPGGFIAVPMTVQMTLSPVAAQQLAQAFARMSSFGVSMRQASQGLLVVGRSVAGPGRRWERHKRLADRRRARRGIRSRRPVGAHLDEVAWLRVQLARQRRWAGAETAVAALLLAKYRTGDLHWWDAVAAGALLQAIVVTVFLERRTVRRLKVKKESDG